MKQKPVLVCPDSDDVAIRKAVLCIQDGLNSSFSPMMRRDAFRKAAYYMGFGGLYGAVLNLFQILPIPEDPKQRDFAWGLMGSWQVRFFMWRLRCYWAFWERLLPTG